MPNQENSYLSTLTIAWIHKVHWFHQFQQFSGLNWSICFYVFHIFTVFIVALYGPPGLAVSLHLIGSIMLHKFKLGSVALSLILEPTHPLIFLSQDSWLTPNEFQFISGRETAKVSIQNKHAKLRRCESRVHFGKIHF